VGGAAEVRPRHDAGQGGELIDSMRNGGCEFGGETYEDFSLEVRTKLYTQLLVIAGFFTKETAAEMLANLAPAT